MKKFVSVIGFLVVGSFGFAQEWVARYNGPGNDRDEAKAIAVDGNGNVYVTGWSVGIYYEDYATIKYTSSGDTAWVRRYDGPDNKNDGAWAIAVDGLGNVYVTGASEGSDTYSDYVTIKYNPDGDTLWVRRYNGPGNGYDVAYAIAVDGDGYVYVTGKSMGSGTSWDYATIKYTPAGDTAWIRRYNGPGNFDDDASAIAVDGSGNVYVTGSSWGLATSDYATIKYTPAGDTAWVRRYDGPDDGTEGVRAIAVDGLGNVYVTGVSYGSGTSWDYATIKYNSAGDELWVRRYNGPGNDEDWAEAIAVDGLGNVYVTGESYGSGTSFDYATIKYTPSGDTAWVRRYDGPDNNGDYASAIAVDGSGNVYVTGTSWESGKLDYATIKYTPAGDTAWVRRYDGPGNGDDGANAIAVDGSGNVYVTGLSWGSGTHFDYATIKYSAVVGVEEQIPENRPPRLEVYPNPCIRSAVISYRLSVKGKVSLGIYDLSGRLVRNIYSGVQSAGYYEVGAELPAGIYFIRLETGDFIVTKKLTLLR